MLPIDNLPLFLDRLARLRQPRLRLLDLGLDVDSALDEEVDGGGRADRLHHAAAGGRVVVGEDFDTAVRHGFTAEGPDGCELGFARCGGGAVGWLDEDRGGLEDGVLGGEGSDGLGDGEDEFVGLFGFGVVESLVVLRIGGQDDGGRVVSGSTW